MPKACLVGDLIVIPALDESVTLPELLARVKAASPRTAMLVVDDGSADGTGRLAAAAGAEVLRHHRPLGYGRSLLDGIRWAQGHDFERLVTLDADLQHEPESIPEFLRVLDHADIAAGSRYHPACRALGRTPAPRRRINRELTHRLNRLTGLRRTDVFCGFNGYRTPTLSGLRLDQAGYLFTLQLWVQAARHRLRIEEVPVRRIYLRDRRYGSGLDDPAVRRALYLDFLARETRR
ncbi:MAG: glycosyltransferase family 2 protein [Armatimonadetes bacterium]|nr:glycosyltransferase family 2 protein [Armatimonadota bacterium]